MFTGYIRTIASPDAGADAYDMCGRSEFQIEIHIGKGETSCLPYGVHSDNLEVCRFLMQNLARDKLHVVPQQAKWNV